jgi:hypothetical protein
MASKPSTSVHKNVGALWREGTTAGLTDGQLLERFIDQRHAAPEAAEAAFAAIVDRHGTMVLRTCQRILGEEHEAQDGAQATFWSWRVAHTWPPASGRWADGCTRSRSEWPARQR